MISYAFGRGPFTSGNTESVAYVKTPYSPYADPNWPDVEIIQIALQAGDDPSPGTQSYYRMKSSIMNQYFKPLFNTRAFMYSPLLMHSRTKGSMKLKSTNPYDHPIFNYKYFEDERDLKALAYGIQAAINITGQKPFIDLGVEQYTVPLPGCETIEFNTIEYWQCYVRVLTTTFYHYINLAVVDRIESFQVGTCKMGPTSDPTTVVDARLRVHGMKNLRVVDVGIIPTPPSAHLAALAYMIGEKGADMIKQDNGLANG
ncbi:glucose dehydrogenase [Culex quinquefasciatus]|uniref:Glucose dehydrogenase n=1 Tax=Culex quinquefasciatus TaxID=7176 RepID=B0XDG1_CULQU|nr:glucose dehydrogenase [Culex quinquefasciatus]|eukprot:XP_001867683.1 glucose dehydrogenase [Culex quinquefasciatus]